MLYTKNATVRLINYAVLAFFGALVLGQSIGTASDSPIILWGFEIPRLPEFVTVVAILLLCLTSVYLAVASVFKKMQTMAVRAINTFAYVFNVLFWLLFTYAYLDAASALPYDHWWAHVLFVIGYAFFVFLGVRFALHRPNT